MDGFALYRCDGNQNGDDDGDEETDLKTIHPEEEDPHKKMEGKGISLLGLVWFGCEETRER